MALLDLEVRPSVGCIVQPSDVEVSAEQFAATVREAGAAFEAKLPPTIRRTIQRLVDA